MVVHSLLHLLGFNHEKVKDFKIMKDERIDLVLDICKFTAHFFMLGLCFFNIFASDVPILEDVWTVLLAICLFRMVELGDKR